MFLSRLNPYLKTFVWRSEYFGNTNACFKFAHFQFWSYRSLPFRMRTAIDRHSNKRRTAVVFVDSLYFPFLIKDCKANKIFFVSVIFWIWRMGMLLRKILKWKTDWCKNDYSNDVNLWSKHCYFINLKKKFKVLNFIKSVECVCGYKKRKLLLILLEVQ